MVTPVHRFHQLEHSTISPSAHSYRYRPNSFNGGPVVGETTRVEVDSSLYLESPPTESVAGYRGATGAPPGSEGVLSPGVGVVTPGVVHPGAPAHSASTRFRCGMWASFGLATVFAAGIKFYFYPPPYGSRLEVLVFCTVLVVMLYLVAGCALSACRGPTGGGGTPLLLGGVEPSSHPRGRGDSASSPPPPHPPAGAVILSTVLVPLPPPPRHHPTTPPPPPDGPPPPYHIAVSFPLSDTPPPTYEKAMS